MDLKKYLPGEIVDWINKNGENAEDITLISKKNMFISFCGKILESPHFISEQLFEDVVNKMCRGSLYAKQQTLKNGYISLPGGIRVGVTGKCILSQGKVEYMHNITAINIRFSREIIGAADQIMLYIKEKDRIFNTLIVSPPSGGKTTLLRDISRQLGNQYRVGVVDERGELSGGMDLGKYTFILEECEKCDGVIMLLRSMSPQVIITDEVGTAEDEYIINRLVNAGVKIICTAHGFDEKDIMRRSVFKSMINEKVFERIIVLSGRNGPGTLEKIIKNN